MYEDYEKQTEDIHAAIKNLTLEREELEQDADGENPFLTAYRECKNFNKLTRDILIELVDYIKVFENGSISVKLKYRDDILRITEYAQNKTPSDEG